MDENLEQVKRSNDLYFQVVEELENPNTYRNERKTLKLQTILQTIKFIKNGNENPLNTIH